MSRTRVVKGSPEHRARIIAGLRQWCEEQRALLADLDHWNRTHPEDERIDMPEIREMLTTGEQMLANDPGHGPLAPFQWRITREPKSIQ